MVFLIHIWLLLGAHRKFKPGILAKKPLQGGKKSCSSKNYRVCSEFPALSENHKILTALFLQMSNFKQFLMIITFDRLSPVGLLSGSCYRTKMTDRRSRLGKRQIQDCLGNALPATTFGWEAKDDRFIPVPECLLKMVRCECRKDCETCSRCRIECSTCVDLCTYYFNPNKVK
ncbi:uncharacterized protein LOC130895032 [Diorhabda carinulata]|uniref:uncharacterized protein LOC130895032 n=1 Tax=Diorhabda carinulata TaxID=1163345 RepID=UPI0025A034DD|nr:uncharacterized protein LOC130895032 [Diorhabda carinulata]